MSRRNDRPMSSLELNEQFKGDTTTDFVARVNGRRQGPPPKLMLLDADEMLTTDPPPLDWLVEGVAHRGSLSMLYGQEKQGKSMLTQAIAREMIKKAGGSVAGLRVKPGTVMLVDAENGEAVIHRRLHLLDVSRDDAERLKPVIVGPGGFDLCRDMGELHWLMGAHAPDLVVLDSFRTLWDGDEDSSRETSPVLVALNELARGHRAAILMIHHDGTNDSKPGRGSTAIPAVAETNVRLLSMRDDPDPQRRRLFSRTRHDEDRTVWLRIDADEDTGSIGIEITEPLAGDRAPAAKVSRKDPELLARVRDSLTGEFETLKSVAERVGLSPKSRTLRNYLDELRDEGTAEKDDETRMWRLADPATAERLESPGVTPFPGVYTTYTGTPGYTDARPNGKLDPSMVDGLEEQMAAWGQRS